jgi:hypothetical protein
MQAIAIAAAGLGAVVAGCGSGAPAATDAAALYSCDTETRAVRYMPGLERTSVSGAFKAVLVESVPGPPIKGQNMWTVRIFDASGATPRDGLTVTALPSMPDHVHPTAVKPVVTPKNDGSGTYVLDPVYLFMAGFWEVKLTVQPADGPKDTIIFPVCISG